MSKKSKKLEGKMQVLTITVKTPGFLGHNNKIETLNVPIPAFTEKRPERKEIILVSWALSEPVETPKGMKIKKVIAIDPGEVAKA